MNSEKGRVLAIGALLGAVTGLATAYLLLQRSEKDGRELKISTGEGVRLGLLLLGLLRQVSELGGLEDAKKPRKR
jgi:hypothetical protein